MNTFWTLQSNAIRAYARLRIDARLFAKILLLIVFSDFNAFAQTCTAEAGFPVDPLTLQPVCPPYDRPAVFFTPHADDETIGMAGAIIRAARAGRTVIIELMTTGGDRTPLCKEDSRHTDPTHPLYHPGPYLGCPSHAEVRLARLREFQEAAQILGVTAIRIAHHPDGSLRASDVAARARFWIERQDTGLTLTGTAGRQEWGAHPDHIAVHDGLSDANFGSTSWQRVYTYLDPNPPASEHVRLSPSECAQKRAALLAYNRWDPQRGRYAFGWTHSASYLFRAVYASCAEYAWPRTAGPSR